MIKNWLIGLIVFSMVIAGVSAFYISTSESYNVTDIDTSFSSTYNVMSNMTNLTASMQREVSGGTPNWLEATILITKGVWTALQLPFRSIAWVTTMVTEAGKEIGIPTWFSGGIILIIILAMIFAIMAAIFKVHNI